METQHQSNSVLSVNKAMALQASHFKNKNPVPTFRGNINIPSYNKANHTDSPLARLSGVGRRYVSVLQTEGIACILDA